jgi:hypothetical protein
VKGLSVETVAGDENCLLQSLGKQLEVGQYAVLRDNIVQCTMTGKVFVLRCIWLGLRINTRECYKMYTGKVDGMMVMWK